MRKGFGATFHSKESGLQEVVGSYEDYKTLNVKVLVNGKVMIDISDDVEEMRLYFSKGKIDEMLERANDTV
jgi:hypothetical protein